MILGVYIYERRPVYIYREAVAFGSNCSVYISTARSSIVARGKPITSALSASDCGRESESERGRVNALLLLLAG